MQNEIYTVAIVGRPNVGKSSLFNKLAKQRLAIVSDQAGITRDRNYTKVCYEDKSFILVDTGGLLDDKDKMQAELNTQTTLAIAEADLIIFLVDGASGATPDDVILANTIRKLNKDVLLVANKCEKINNNANEFYNLSLGEVLAISATQNFNINTLLNLICKKIIVNTAVKDIDSTVFCLIGKPNTGKSTLINKLTRSERSIVADVAGTTRDAISIDIVQNNNKYKIIDTAGMRRKSKIKCNIEKFSVIRSLNAISMTDVVVYVIDISDDISDQDCKIINYIIDEGKPLVIAINKCDLLSKDDIKEKTMLISEKLYFANFAIFTTISAVDGSGIRSLWRAIDTAKQATNLEVKSNELIKVIQKATSINPPPIVGKSRIKLQYAHCSNNKPITIIIHGKQVNKLTAQYKRYLVKTFYKSLNIVGAPIKLYFKNDENPFIK